MNPRILLVLVRQRETLNVSHQHLFNVAVQKFLAKVTVGERHFDKIVKLTERVNGNQK